MAFKKGQDLVKNEEDNWLDWDDENALVGQIDALCIATNKLDDGTLDDCIASDAGGTAEVRGELYPIYEPVEADFSGIQQNDFQLNKQYTLKGAAIYGAAIVAQLDAFFPADGSRNDHRVAMPIIWGHDETEVLTFRGEDIARVNAQVGRRLYHGQPFDQPYYFIDGTAIRYPQRIAALRRDVDGLFDAHIAAVNATTAQGQPNQGQDPLPTTPLFVYAGDPVREIYQRPDDDFSTPTPTTVRPTRQGAGNEKKLDALYGLEDRAFSTPVPAECYTKIYQAAAPANPDGTFNVAISAGTAAGNRGVPIPLFITGVPIPDRTVFAGNQTEGAQSQDLQNYVAQGVRDFFTLPIHADAYAALRALTAPITIAGFRLPADLSRTENPAPKVRSKGELTLNEPLLGFKGMSQFKPIAMFPPIERFSPLLQDFRYRFSQPYDIASKIAFDSEFDEEYTFRIRPGEITLRLQSAPTFEQQDKELYKHDVPTTFIETFSTKLAYTADMRSVTPPPISVKIETTRGKPSFVFVYMERVNTALGIREEPVVRHIRIRHIGQDFKTVSDYTSEDLYYLTCRNSHPKADTLSNEKVHGAVLLSEDDLANFSFWNQDRLLTFDLEVDDYAFIHEEVETVAPNTDLRLKVLLIYNTHSLKGVAHEARFWDY